VLKRISADLELEGVGLAPPKPLSPPLDGLIKAWLKRRESTHRSWRDDKNRWAKHLSKPFGKLRPNELDEAGIRRFIDAKLAAELAPASVGLCVRLLSTFFSDLVEEGHVDDNPVKRLRRATRRLYRADHDPMDTPFLERLDDVRRVYQALPAPYSVMFAVGALAGLRTGEVIALSWSDIDIAARRMQVRRQARHGKLGPLKDSEGRTVPLQTALVPILSEWKLATGGQGAMFPPTAKGRGRAAALGAQQFIKDSTLNTQLRTALTACEIPELTWYGATRHSYASQWVIGGGSIETLSKTLGHSRTQVTERYAHLRVDLFRDSDYERFAVNLNQATAKVVTFPQQQAENGCSVVTGEDEAAEDIALTAQN
jgi:integrase